MKLLKNRRGITLIELIISIALISVVLLFLFRILVLLRYDENYDAQNSKMMVNKSQIIQNIQTDFIEKGLKKVICNEGESTTTFEFEDTSSKILKFDGPNLLYGVVNQEEGRALDDGFIYGGVLIDQKTTGENSYIYFKISVNYDNNDPASQHDISFIYTYKNNDISLEGGCIIDQQ